MWALCCQIDDFCNLISLTLCYSLFITWNTYCNHVYYAFYSSRVTPIDNLPPRADSGPVCYYQTWNRSYVNEILSRVFVFFNGERENRFGSISRRGDGQRALLLQKMDIRGSPGQLMFLQSFMWNMQTVVYAKKRDRLCIKVELCNNLQVYFAFPMIRIHLMIFQNCIIIVVWVMQGVICETCF